MLARFLTISALALLIFVNLEYWHFFWLGWFILPIFLWLTYFGFEKLLIKYFNFKENERTKLLGVLLGLIIFGSLCGAAVVFYKLTAWLIAVIMLLVSLVSLYADYRAGKINNKEEAEMVEEPVIEIKQSKSYLIAYLVFAFFGLLLLWNYRTGEAIETPWQVIAPNYIYIFFLAVLSLGGLIFSKIKTKTLLVLLILQTFMMVAYLPMSHRLFYGADGWRHIASVEHVVKGETVEITNYATDDSWATKLNPGVLSYSQFWGVTGALSRILQVDLVSLFVWFQPILFALFIPILFYEIGCAFGWTGKKSLVFSWFGLWPFALQAAGSFSLPVGFGFIIFLFLFLLLLKKDLSLRREQTLILILLGILSVFGYALYLILFILAWISLVIGDKLKVIKGATKNKVVPVAIFLAVALFIPFLEMFAGYSRLDLNTNFVSKTIQAVGNFSGYYLANGPRPHTIDTGNVFFNQTPSFAFVPNAITAWRWWMPFFMSLIFAGIIYGAYKFWQTDEFKRRWLVIFGAGIFFSYFVGRYMLVGDQILSRRLDAVIAFLGIIFVFNSVQKVFERNQFATLLIIILGSIAITSSYSLGPVSRAMSLPEYETAKKVWSEIQSDDKYCVIGDTYQLLALEAVSAKKVVGGGFPIDKNFGQKELTGLFDNFKRNDSDELWNEAKTLTGADKCYLIINNKIEFKSLSNSI